MEIDEEVHEALTEIVRSELSQLATLEVDSDNSAFPSDISRPLTEEEALFLENEIIAEEGDCDSVLSDYCYMSIQFVFQF